MENTFNNRKVAIIGAGFVGSSIAYGIVMRDIAKEIVLIDIDSEKAQGEVNDIRHGFASMGNTDLYAGTYTDCADCDLIIITAGRGRKPGETRLDLVRENIKVMNDVVESIKKYYTRGVILIISNPVDILTCKVTEWMGLPDGMVFSSGCMLDTSRFVRCVADYIGVRTNLINGYIVGEHGDSQVPVWSHVTVCGIPITEYCKKSSIEWNSEVRNRIAGQTKTMGAEIIKAKGKTQYGIAACVCLLAEAIVNHKQTIVSVSSVLQGEYGVRDVSLSVPSVVGENGVQQRIYEKWITEEKQAFLKSVESIRNTLKEID